MTGSRVSLRRWSGCNLHWYTPGRKAREKRMRASRTRPFGEPLWFTRYRLYTLPEYYTGNPGSRYHRDKHGVYVWLDPDCGWEWLSTRKFVYHTPLFRPFDTLHDHVHTKHREDRMNLPLQVQRRIVSALESADALLDAVPVIEVEVTQPDPGRRTLVVHFVRHGGWGCRLGIANFSEALDQRWGTEVWKTAKPYEITFVTDRLEPELYERVEQEFFPDAEIDVSTPGTTLIRWVERGVTAEDALSEAREALIATGLYPELGQLLTREVTA